MVDDLARTPNSRDVLVSHGRGVSDGDTRSEDFPMDSGNHLFLSSIYSHRLIIRLRRLLKLHSPG